MASANSRGKKKKDVFTEYLCLGTVGAGGQVATQFQIGSRCCQLWHLGVCELLEWTRISEKEFVNIKGKPGKVK